MFGPLSKDDAKQFLHRLWIETYAETHTPEQTAKQRNWLHLKDTEEETYEYKLRLFSQIILCPKDCQRKPPHLHVDEKRRSLIIKKRFPKKKSLL